MKHYAAISLVNYEKQISKTFYTAARKDSAALFTKVIDNINIAKEIADSLRIMFDFNLKSVLLYGSHGEQKQYKEVMKPGKNLVKDFSSSYDFLVKLLHFFREHLYDYSICILLLQIKFFS